MAPEMDCRFLEGFKLLLMCTKLSRAGKLVSGKFQESMWWGPPRKSLSHGTFSSDFNGCKFTELTSFFAKSFSSALLNRLAH